MAGEKIRFRFEKAGDLRLLSHLDTARSCERLLRRARVPFRSTQGFHPSPRAVFALSLPLGVVGRNEVFELELLEPHEPDELRDRLNAHSPDGLRFTSAKCVEMKATAVPRRVVYRLALPADRVEPARAAAASLLASDKVWAARVKPRPRRVNVRPYLRDVRADADGLALDLWVTNSGTARADELFALLGVADLTAAGAVIERSELEIHDETPPGQPDGPPEGPPETAALEHPPAAAAGADEASAAATWGLSPNGPEVE